MLLLTAQIIVALTGVYFCVLGLLSLFKADLAQRFLSGFASTARLHYLELALRLLAGGALVIAAPQMMHARVFALFGWVLIITTAGLLLMPWRWHQRFARQSVPPVLRFIAVIGVCALAMGAYLLLAVKPGLPL